MGHFGSIHLFLNIEIPTQWSKPIFYLRTPLQIKSELSLPHTPLMMTDPIRTWFCLAVPRSSQGTGSRDLSKKLDGIVDKKYFLFDHLHTKLWCHFATRAYSVSRIHLITLEIGGQIKLLSQSSDLAPSLVLDCQPNFHPKSGSRI